MQTMHLTMSIAHPYRHPPPRDDDNCPGEQADSEHQGDPSAGGGAGGGTGGGKVDDLFSKPIAVRVLNNKNYTIVAGEYMQPLMLI